MCVKTYIEAIMRDVGRHCYVIMAYGLIDIFIVLHQHPLWPHELFCPPETIQINRMNMVSDKSLNFQHIIKQMQQCCCLGH